MHRLNRLPPGIAYHRGVLFDEANLEAVLRYVITNRPECAKLTPQELSNRVWAGLERMSNGFSADELASMAERLECVHGVYFTLSWNALEGLCKEGVWCRGRLITFLARLGKPAVHLING